MNRQRRWKPDLLRLKRDLERALVLTCERHPLPSTIEEIEFVLVGRSESGRIHRCFFADPSPTDVMTFATPPSASIIICPEMALIQCRDEGTTPRNEVLTYAIHGLLHLSGMDDRTPDEFKAMRRAQSRVMALVTAKSAGPPKK